MINFDSEQNIAKYKFIMDDELDPEGFVAVAIAQEHEPAEEIEVVSFEEVRREV